MRRLLKEISVIPGVAGSCIFDKNEGAVCTELDSELSKNLTEQVGIHFVRLVQMGGMNKLQIKSAHFRFDRYSVVGLPLENGTILLAICDSQANCSLVATTAGMLVDDMRDELEKPLLPPDGEAVGRSGSAPAAAPVATGDEPGLGSVVQEIEEALALAIGPVAVMIMADYLNRWRETGPADRTRLAELINMLAREIDHAELEREFTSRLKHLL
ncbi:MAG: hypothetical protein C4563_02845 [Desulfobulbus sp.]|mgnify:FL=1|nr:MAG: hypothetical protein C4563_02845 [Desulfobulbus sp.]